MRELCNYREQIRLREFDLSGEQGEGGKKIERLDFCAYCIDGGNPQCETFDMGAHVGLASCSRCDYFVFGKKEDEKDGKKEEKKVVYLIEFTNIVKQKEELQKKYKKKNNVFRPLFGLSEESRLNIERQLFEDSVINENLVKVYGTMLVFSWFAHKCESMKKNLQKREICLKIAFRIPKDQAEKDARKAWDNLRSKLEQRVQGQTSLTTEAKECLNAPSDSFVTEVEFIFYHDKKTLEDNLRNITVCEPDG